MDSTAASQFNSILVDAITKIGEMKEIISVYGLDKYRSQALALRTSLRTNPYFAYNQMVELLHNYKENFSMIADGKCISKGGKTLKTTLTEEERYRISTLDFIKEEELKKHGVEDGILAMMKTSWNELSTENKKILANAAYNLAKF